MADMEHVEFKVVSSRDGGEEFTDRLAREEENGWTVVGFACGLQGYLHALLRRVE